MKGVVTGAGRAEAEVHGTEREKMESGGPADMRLGGTEAVVAALLETHQMTSQRLIDTHQAQTEKIIEALEASKAEAKTLPRKFSQANPPPVAAADRAAAAAASTTGHRT